MFSAIHHRSLSLSLSKVRASGSKGRKAVRQKTKCVRNSAEVDQRSRNNAEVDNQEQWEKGPQFRQCKTGQRRPG